MHIMIISAVCTLVGMVVGAIIAEKIFLATLDSDDFTD